MNYDNFLKKSIINELTNMSLQKKTLVTEGAYMYCTMGTHEDILNQPNKNGTYLNGKPLLTVKDCKVSTSESDIFSGIPFEKPSETVDGNLYSFGFCRSKFHPLKLNNLAASYSPYSFDYDPDTGTHLFGKENLLMPCVPNLGALMFFTPIGYGFGEVQWQNGHEKLQIEGVPALTNHSCLSCIYGGQIKLLSNGMEPVPSELLHQG
ncbi:hypothetical protein DCC85_05260 [Paenibacillus sp. CAA11]|uniref:DUF4280 domain-containing protein n=1 Tax=Paenibacillus sp. CAA11 TaxID=1532905 RepID=UPI000D3B2067|nr:DUF4280 domain-containing protein [Paenibacillus sp. CAA11]AWB43684.1 hypothetical protein DCC85_05260 [Paenibacillus sp. CAA11]